MFINKKDFKITYLLLFGMVIHNVFTMKVDDVLFQWIILLGLLVFFWYEKQEELFFIKLAVICIWLSGSLYVFLQLFRKDFLLIIAERFFNWAIIFIILAIVKRMFKK